MFLTLAVAALALVGHGALWVGLGNRLHSTGLPRPLVKGLTLLVDLVLMGLPILALLLMLRIGRPNDPTGQRSLAPLETAMLGYSLLCAVVGAYQIVRWGLLRSQAARLPAGVKLAHNSVLDIARLVGKPPAGDLRTRLMARLPGNQLWQLHVNAYDLHLPRLPRVLDGLSIFHWSDLHFCGRIDRTYFEEMVRRTNQDEVDLIVLSGDICDREDCIGWVETLAPARARLGKYYVLGNHDLRTGAVGRLRDAMRAAGFVDLGNRSHLVAEQPLAMTGNEIPWIRPAGGEIEMPPASARAFFKILVSHSPDQYPWARRQEFDLVLAGHTHGGQIRFPVIGPVVCPSWYGTRYAAGFFQHDPTLMYVSRGSASLLPLRWNCPPEITRLVLRCASAEIG